jgi:uncharacterized membrane protein YedE/YeeE
MATAVAVGAIGFHVLERKGMTSKNLKPMKVGGVALGAVLFGAGLAVTGYCPGTSVAAVGEGRRDALATVLGYARRSRRELRSRLGLTPCSAGRLREETARR